MGVSINSVKKRERFPDSWDGGDPDPSNFHHREARQEVSDACPFSKYTILNRRLRPSVRLCFGLTQQDSSSSTRKKLGAQICSRWAAMAPHDSRVCNGTCRRSASCSVRPWSLDSGADWRLKAYFAAFLLQLLTITPRTFSWYAGQRLQEQSFSFGYREWIARSLRIGSRSERDAAPPPQSLRPSPLPPP